MSLSKPIWSLFTPSSYAWAHDMSAGCVKSEISPLHWNLGNCLAGINADGGTDRWKQEEPDKVKWVWRRDGSERGKVFGRWMDWCWASQRWGGGGGLEVWDRRLLSCLFEDKSERQSSEEVCIHKHKHTHTSVCVCVSPFTVELTHMQTHGNTNTLTISVCAHSAHRRGGKRPRMIGRCGLTLPRVAEQCMLGCLDTNAVIIKAWGRSPFFSFILLFWTPYILLFSPLLFFSPVLHLLHIIPQGLLQMHLRSARLSLLINPSFMQLMWMNSSS